MKQIVVISGKGGTGKTVLTGALAALIEHKVIVDCDVDAPDLHLLLEPTIEEEHVFQAGFTAIIDHYKCIKCHQCEQVCRFDAIHNLLVNHACEGCRLCSYVCPADAIIMQEKIAGAWFVSTTRYGTFVHAKLGIAEGNSGKLVTLIRNKALEIAKPDDWILIDGAPGIGCPVIACISNTDCAVVVTEPTLSGLADAKRVIEVANYFKVLVKLVINKFDLNLEMTKTIETYCQNNHIQVVGKIPFSHDVVTSIVNNKTLMETSNLTLKNSIQQIWSNIITNI